MRSNIKRKNYNLILVLIFIFNLVTQTALPAVAFATEVDSVTDDATENIETVEADASALELPIMHINDTHGNVQKLAFMVDEIEIGRAHV